MQSLVFLQQTEIFLIRATILVPKQTQMEHLLTTKEEGELQLLLYCAYTLNRSMLVASN